jgi:hypothetical protein
MSLLQLWLVVNTLVQRQAKRLLITLTALQRTLQLPLETTAYQ